MDREKAVEYLTANCDCWKDGADVLNELDEEAVVEMAENALVVNAAREVIGEEDISANEMPAALKKMVKGKKPAAEDEDGDEDYQSNNTERGRSMTDEEFMAAAPPAVRRMVENAQRTERRERKTLVARLTANVRPGKALDRLIKTYDKLDVDDLRAMAAAIPQPRLARNADEDEVDDDDEADVDVFATTRNRRKTPARRDRDADYSGAGYVGNRGRDDDADGPPDQGPLRPVTYNWDQIRTEQRQAEQK